MLRTDWHPGTYQWDSDMEEGISREAAVEVDFKAAAARLERLTAPRDEGAYRGLFSAPAAFHSHRFDGVPIFAAVARGDFVLATGSSDQAANTVLQMTLYSLGYDLGPERIDGSFGQYTRVALAKFQGGRTAGAVGVLDGETLALLDEAAAEQADQLRAAAIDDRTKAKRFRVIVDLAGILMTLYVLDRASGKPVARYLVSPGSEEFPTPALSGRVGATKVRSWWNPPASDWAKDMEPAPPGIDNPMGLVKHHLAGSFYIHGIPKFEEKDLGRPASHGCVRMSSANILELTGHYVGVGSRYEVSFDSKLSEALSGAAAARGLSISDVEAGREYLAAVATGEMW